MAIPGALAADLRPSPAVVKICYFFALTLSGTLAAALSPAAADRNRRSDFLCRAIDLAADLGAGCVSLWAGVGRDAADEETLWRRLLDGLGPVLKHAGDRGVVLGFEPEPGMFVDTVARAEQLLDRLRRPAGLGLTIDVGHLECLGERPLAATVARVAKRVVNVHADDMLVCRHEHLPQSHCSSFRRFCEQSAKTLLPGSGQRILREATVDR